MDICRVLTLSTCHIREETARALDECAYTELVIYKKERFGWWIYIPRYWQDIIKNVPDDLAACIELAADNCCEWLCLDRDGKVEDLPSYDW